MITKAVEVAFENLDILGSLKIKNLKCRNLSFVFRVLTY